MSTDIVINVDNVSKAYTIWSSPSARLHGPILGQIGQMPILPSGTREWCRRHSQRSFRNFYALRNISFSVQRGESVGIIGRNGSGKSTLLQIIAGTLLPTEGEVTVNGTVAALLELGSGFNPEFTGRENVYMNAAIRGMSREQTDTKFDEIKAFADIGDFIEQPTKMYSSGMSLRLAFAVQAILNQDILIVDEALAVGDEAFQRKCFSRIQSFRENGGTILFVSHAAGMIIELCDQAILLDYGAMILSGKPRQVIAKYHKLLYAPAEKRAQIVEEIRSVASAPVATDVPAAVAGPSEAENTTDEAFDPGMVPKSTVVYEARGMLIVDPQITTLSGRAVNTLVRGREYMYRYKVKAVEPALKVRFGMLIKTVSGLELGGFVSHSWQGGIEYLDRGQVAEVAFRFRCLLQPGVYFLNAGVLGVVGGTEVFLARHVDVAMFRVQAEQNIRVTGLVDFCIEVQVSLGEGATITTSPVRQDSGLGTLASRA